MKPHLPHPADRPQEGRNLGRIGMWKRLKNWFAGMLALVSLAAAMPAEAVLVIGNRNRYELDQMMQFDDIKAQMGLAIANYPSDTAISQTDYAVPTADNDARCNNFIRQKLNGMKGDANSTNQQKIDKANDVLAMFKGAQANGGLGAAIPARGQPSGWSSFYSGLPKEPGQASKMMEIIDISGGSWTVRLTNPGGSGGDPINVYASALLDIKSPAATTGNAANPAACPF